MNRGKKARSKAEAKRCQHLFRVMRVAGELTRQTQIIIVCRTSNRLRRRSNAGTVSRGDFMQIDWHPTADVVSAEAGEIVSDQPVRAAMPHRSRLW
jgi:UDP-N-acetylenolpyruvoylglucosamine reductase